MTMLTQCPACHTTFRVTSEILRVADGQVRCGRCQTQFDAFERLLEESDDGDVEFVRHLRTAPPSPEEPVIEQTVSITEPGEPDAGTDEEWLQDTDTEQPTVEEPQAPLDTEDSRAQEPDNGDIEPELTPGADSQGTQSGLDEAAPVDPHTATGPDADLELLQRPQRKSPKLWAILAGPLVLVLVVQLVHANRASLALNPQIGPALVRIYQQLGLTLRPDWDLNAYDFVRRDVVSDPATPGTLKVRVSLKNTAEFPQPYPLLRLELVDRWGERVRARDFTPAEYLPGTPGRLLDPAEQVNATLSIVDPGPDAESFRFDVCLEGARGTMCTADVPRGRR
jgi:predicted Zn finger-like uncharacterized protein